MLSDAKEYATQVQIIEAMPKDLIMLNGVKQQLKTFSLKLKSKNKEELRVRLDLFPKAMEILPVNHSIVEKISHSKGNSPNLLNFVVDNLGFLQCYF